MSETSVLLKTSGGREATGELALHHPSLGQKAVRAGLKFALFLVAAACTALIPVMHFFTVPSLLLYGVFAAITILRAEVELTGGEVSCPACAVTLPTGTGFRRWPIDVICADCGRPVEITRSVEGE